MSAAKESSDKGEGWIEWGGGEARPVGADVSVDVELRNGKRGSGRLSCCYDWRHLGTEVVDGDSDIIAYRIHKES